MAEADDIALAESGCAIEHPLILGDDMASAFEFHIGQPVCVGFFFLERFHRPPLCRGRSLASPAPGMMTMRIGRMP